MKGHTPEATRQSGRNIGLPASLVAGLMPHLNPRAVDTGSNDVRVRRRYACRADGAAAGRRIGERPGLARR